MKIKIKDNKKSFSISLPTNFIFSKWFLKKIFDEKISFKIKPIKTKLKNALKNYIKQNGHFHFIEIESNDNEKVIIEI